jgi:hypothetical protein
MQKARLRRDRLNLYVIELTENDGIVVRAGWTNA